MKSWRRHRTSFSRLNKVFGNVQEEEKLASIFDILKEAKSLYGSAEGAAVGFI